MTRVIVMGVYYHPRLTTSRSRELSLPQNKTIQRKLEFVDEAKQGVYGGFQGC